MLSCTVNWKDKKKRAGISISRRKFSVEQKVMILCKHLGDQVPVSVLCERYQIHPTIFYRWKKQLFEGALVHFSGKQKKTEETINRLSRFKEAWLTESLEQG